MQEPRGVSTHIYCSGPLLTQTSACTTASSQPQHQNTERRACTYSPSHLSVWATTEQVIWSVLKAEALLRFLDFPYTPQIRGAVAGAGAGEKSKASLAISSQGLDLSPPMLALQEQPVFFLPSGGRTAVRKNYCIS